MDLCHYTSLAGLHGIISSKSIWATHYSFLNDIKEFSYGLECLDKYLNSPISAEDNDWWREHFTTVTNHISNFKTPEIYSTSFCLKKDLLSQWRGYGQQGVCIVFDKILFNKIGWWNSNPYNKLSDAPKDFLIPKFDLYHNPVEYIDEGAEYTAINDIINKIKIYYEGIYNGGMKDDIIFEGLRAKLFGLTIPFIKHPSFREEGEYRLLALSVNNPSDLKFRCDGKFIIPYIEMSVKENILPISEIVIGPGGNGKALEKGIQMMLNNYGYNEVNISHSNIPYRT